jgi:predicted Mrr-cat superfamily restriction endonuclease
MVRAGQGSTAALDFEQKRVVAIGWFDVDWTKYADSKSIEARIRELVPGKSARQQITASSQIERFLRGIHIGDRVVTHDAARRLFLIGSVKGAPVYALNAIAGLPTQRSVQWDGKVRRDWLSAKTLKALGAISTLFLIANLAAAELEATREPL